MAAAILFYANGNLINNAGGSGIGFFTDGFGGSTSVGAYPNKAYLTSSNGTDQGAEVNSVKYSNPGSGILGAGSGIGLKSIPNSQASLQIRFTNDTPVKVQNAKLYMYDRVSINNEPSGILVKCVELAHPGITQAFTGSGDDTWQNIASTGSILSLGSSPGVSGQFYGAGASLWQDTVHDWYIAISPSPSTIGSKLFSALVSLEYV